jgi:hypothetical protein
MPPSSSMEAVTPLVERLNHLESLLVSNLLGFLLTITITIFGAAYELRPAAKTPPFATPTQLFVGVSILYVFLSGYYYFMLAQFYACVITLMPLAKSLGVEINALWSTLRIPSFGVISNRMANMAMLTNAPLLPLAFSVFSLISLRLVVEGHGGRNVGVIATTVGISLQGLVCILVIIQPFRSFIKATLAASAVSDPALIQEPCGEAGSGSQEFELDTSEHPSPDPDNDRREDGQHGHATSPRPPS